MIIINIVIIVHLLHYFLYLINYVIQFVYYSICFLFVVLTVIKLVCCSCLFAIYFFVVYSFKFSVHPRMLLLEGCRVASDWSLEENMHHVSNWLLSFWWNFEKLVCSWNNLVIALVWMYICNRILLVFYICVHSNITRFVYYCQIFIYFN